MQITSRDDVGAELQDMWGYTKQESSPLLSDPMDSLERLYSGFMRDVLLAVDFESLVFEDPDDVDPFNAIGSSRQHAELLYGLIKSDVQNRKDDDDELRLVMKKEFPTTYRRALQFISEMLETIKSHDTFSSLYSIVKFIPRKEGLRLNAESLEKLMSVREIVEIKRKIERSLSSILLLCITYRSVYNTPGAKRDFMYFAKGMVERLPVQDKHFALLLYCRGVLHPAYIDTTDQTEENGLRDEYKVDVQGLTRAPLLSLRDSFVNNMKTIGVKQPSSASRMLFPFAATALRAYKAMSDNKPFVVVDENKDLFGSDHSATASATATASGEGDGMAAVVSPGMYSGDEQRLCELFRDCADIDLAARRSNGLEETGTELLSNLRRWLTELTAVHFINDEVLLLRAETLPPEITRNTVAMELLATSSTFVLGKKKQRVAYMAHMAGLGRKVQVALEAFEAWRLPGEDGQGQGQGQGGEGGMNLSDVSDGSTGATPEEDDDIDREDPEKSQGQAFTSPIYEAVQLAEFTGVSARHPVANVKKWMTIVNVLSFLLPQGHPLAGRVDTRFRLSILGQAAAGKTDAKTQTLLSDIVQAKMRKMRSKVGALYAIEGYRESSSIGYGGSDGGGLWGAKKEGGRVARPGRRDALDMRSFLYPSLQEEGALLAEGQKEGGEDEEGLWTSIFSLRKRKARTSSSSSSSLSSTTSISTISRALDTFLLHSVAPILEADLADPAQTEQLAQELSYVYMRWRNPALLFDYYRIHNMAFTKDVQGPYRRFLRALLGASEETAEQIRFCDPGNRRHLERFPPEVTRPWVEGRTAQGEVLPGYSDPQTLFMLGEDAQSCMMVKPRQRNTNRALLSFVLHGNVRILGVKDPSGKLRTRAVVKLLEDKETRRPVLYVESPVHVGSGGTDAVLDIYDQAAELGSALGLPVVYAVQPDASKYYMGNTELAAASLSSEYFTAVQRGHVEEEEEEDKPVLLHRRDFALLVDHSDLSPYVWVDGVRDPVTGRFINGMTPMLYKRAEAGTASSSGSGSGSHSASPEDAIDATEAIEAEEAEAEVDYYANGFRLPGTLENVYSREAVKGAYLPDYTCGPGKSAEYYDSMAWAVPIEVSRQNSRRARGSGDSPFTASSSGKGGKDKKKVSMQEMLIERQNKINALSGRAERVEKEKEEANGQRERRRLGLGLDGRGEVVQTDNGEEEKSTPLERVEEVPPAEEEGAGIFDDTDDLW